MKGHIRKRGENTWAIVLDVGKGVDGKRRQKWHSVEGTKKDAERELNRLIHTMNTGAYTEPSRQTVGDYLEQWLRDYARGNVSPRTFDWYTEIINKHLIPSLGGNILTRLQPMHIQSYYSQALQSGRRDGKGGLSAQTVLYHHRILREALQHALKWQLLIRNPADATEPPRPVKKEIEVFTEDEIGRLIVAAGVNPIVVPLLLASSTGMRMGEILPLKWSELDLQAGSLAIPKTRAKSGRSRVITLPPILVDVLRRHRAAQVRQRLALGAVYQDGGLVYAQEDGQPVSRSSLSHSFAGLVKRTGLPHRKFHAMRHSHATLLLLQGIHPKVVSERLGHATIGITMDLYSHVMPSMQVEAAQKVNQVLGAAIQRNQQPDGVLTEAHASNMV